MTTREALIADIIAHPDDDLRRLVFADWLEENGEQERAEVILLMIKGRKTKGGFIDTRTRHFKKLQKLIAGLHPGSFRVIGTNKSWGHPPAVCVDLFRPTTRLTYTRGLIFRADCQLATWMRIGPAVVRSHPVTRVDVTDRKPSEAVQASFDRQDRLVGSRNVWVWLESDDVPTQMHNGYTLYQNCVPDLVAKFLSGERCENVRRRQYFARGEAEKDLSSALIAWAKSQPAD